MSTPATATGTFERALSIVLGFEGGVSDDPADRGGLTNAGVTQATYDRYRDRKLLERRPVTQAAWPEVREIYRRDYWEPAKCEFLPPALAIAVFDAAVNHGIGQASLLLQRALWVADDGIVGKGTLAAAAAADERLTIRSMLTLRRDLYRILVKVDSTQEKFLRGWRNRVSNLWGSLFPPAAAPPVTDNRET
jgi:lysozyme family protein